MTIPRYLGQVFRTAKQIETIKTQRARYASAVHAYTPSHRARHQELAWHAAVKSARESIDAVEAEDVLEGIAGSSGTSVDNANTKIKLNRSGSAAATNVPFVNGVSQKREFSTTSFFLRSAKQGSSFGRRKGRVGSDETMHNSPTFAISPSSTHTTSDTSTSTTTTAFSARKYSSKPPPTPEEKYDTDEEHRLEEGLVKGDNLMNQDEGMNANEDKIGQKIHPVATHHHNNRNKRPGKQDGGAGASVASYSTSTRPRRAAHSGRDSKEEAKGDRLMDREALKPESYEYTRSGTDNEVGDDPEAYCREHTRPEEEMSEEARLKQEHNPLEFSPANPHVSKPPKEGEMKEASRNVKEKKSAPRKVKKGHKVGTRLGDEMKGEPGL